MFLLLAAVVFYALGYSRGRLAYPALTMGLLVHLVFIVKRALLLHGLPVTERLDVLSLIGFLMVVVLLYVWKRDGTRGIEVWLISFAAFFTIAASMHAPVNSVDVFMKTPWFYAYSMLNIIGYALLGVATSFGLVYLTGGESAGERRQYDYSLYGWTAFSASLITGSAWFFLAYGTYWYWTAREFWLSMAWMMYGGVYIHARYLNSFSGKPAAVLGVLGYPLMVFYYFGIGTLIKSPWSQF